MGKSLTYSDRKIIEQMLSEGYSKREISEKVGKSYGVVCRELRQVCVDGAYSADAGQEQKKRNLSNCGKKPYFLEHPDHALYVAEKILAGYGTKEIVEFFREKNIVISRQRIYDDIKKGYIPGITMESLQKKTVTVFNDGNIVIPIPVRQRLKIHDGDVLDYKVTKDGKIILKKTEKL